MAGSSREPSMTGLGQERTSIDTRNSVASFLRTQLSAVRKLPLDFGGRGDVTVGSLLAGNARRQMPIYHNIAAPDARCRCRTLA